MQVMHKNFRVRQIIKKPGQEKEKGSGIILADETGGAQNRPGTDNFYVLHEGIFPVPSNI